MSVYSIVTNRIIEEMRKGVVPWKKPWMSMGMQSGAYNRVSKRSYSLLNQMLLRYSGEYATANQWSNLGGKIKKDSIAEIIVFWKIKEQEKKDEEGNIKVKQIPILKYYRVYHISCVEGVTPLPKPNLNPIDSIEAGDQLIFDYSKRENLKIEMNKISDKAFYSPVRDYIQVPCKGQYMQINEFYSTVFHEMAHSTGHSTRLNRDLKGLSPFGSKSYGMEELIAEISSAMIMHIIGIGTAGTIKNSAAYIQSWIRSMKEDDHLFVLAASRAEKAVKYIIREDIQL